MRAIKEITRASRVLVGYIEQLADFVILPRNEMVYEHVGAALSDAVLQSGINYRTVVWPRIVNILTTYWEHRTIPAFSALLAELGANTVLMWRHDEKPGRLVALTEYCAANGLVTCADVSAHIVSGSSRRELLRIRGIGPKTIDYLSGLLGIDAVAVDRHIYTFVQLAGIDTVDYDFVRGTVASAADLLGVSRRSLDYAIWYHSSTGSQAQDA